MAMKLKCDGSPVDLIFTKENIKPDLVLGEGEKETSTGSG